MHLQVLRYSSTNESTLGLLFINGEFECYTLEDEPRTEKVFGETRIPEGKYEIKLRTEGGHHQRYSQKFPQDHIGMLWLQDVPNFKWILIHIGNTDDDTAGCLLVGSQPSPSDVTKQTIAKSTSAYLRLYKKVAPKIASGEKVTITYTNFS